eukprot:scaffold98684_cov82-Phaeocystis_antarctica.AAC.1
MDEGVEQYFVRCLQTFALLQTATLQQYHSCHVTSVVVSRPEADPCCGSGRSERAAVVQLLPRLRERLLAT